MRYCTLPAKLALTAPVNKTSASRWGCRKGGFVTDGAVAVRLRGRGDLCQQAIDNIYNVVLIDRHHASALHRASELARGVLAPPARHAFEGVRQRHDVGFSVVLAAD